MMGGMRTLTLEVALALVLGAAAWAAASLTVSWVSWPKTGVLYEASFGWDLACLRLGFSLALAGSADLAMSPTLGVPLLYGLLSDVRLRYDVGLELGRVTLGWGHVCYYALEPCDRWDGGGAELFWLRLEF